MEEVNPQFDTEKALLVLDGSPLCLQELLFLISILDREYRDIFVLTCDGNPEFSKRWVHGTMQSRQWISYENNEVKTIYEWLWLNITRIGQPTLEFQLNDPRFREEEYLQMLIHQQMEIERVRNPSLVAVWFANRSQTPVQEVAKFTTAPKALMDNLDRDVPNNTKAPFIIHETDQANNISVKKIIILFYIL